jgi:uncharacterized membrane protein YhhN
MSPSVAWALGVASLCAVADWVAVHRVHKPLEYLCKPAVMVSLFVAAVLLAPLPAGASTGTARGWFCAALLLSLAGDVFLMLPGDFFLHGLAAFLLAHVAYVTGFRTLGGPLWRLGLAFAAVAVVGGIVGRPILAALARSERGRKMLVPVVAYMVVLSAMTACGLASGRPAAAVGAGLFYASDATIAWHRFVGPKTWHRLAIIISYHLGQAALVVSLGWAWPR